MLQHDNAFFPNPGEATLGSLSPKLMSPKLRKDEGKMLLWIFRTFNNSCTSFTGKMNKSTNI